ncbi:hypothetical protein EHM69_00835 [candidate division KSB1 bacterium]|nr:MAG: hypothetical protein EHM69_00835 [candidate division KSB1 bacterium]
MKHTSLKFWGPALVLVAVLLFCIAAPARTVTAPRGGSPGRIDAADPNSIRSLIVHDIGNVRMTLSNWGEGGNPDGIPGYRGFEFPVNSGSDFLFSSGIWIGAEVNGIRLVSSTTDGDNGTNEFYPIHIGTYPFSRATRSGDWYVTSKNFTTFSDLDYIWGAKSMDDDGDWTEATDDLNRDGKPSANWDLGKGLIGYDDDGDGLVDEDSVYIGIDGIPVEIDADGDGNLNDTGPSGDRNGDGNCAYDPEPRIDEDPAGDISRDWVDNDFDGLVDMDDPDYDGDQAVGSDDDDGDGEFDEDGVARGVQEYYCVFQDDIELNYVGNPNPSDGHTPLRLEVLQRTYAFPEAYAAEFILIDYRIRSANPLPLENVYMALFADPDVAAAGEAGDAASVDDWNYYDADRLMMIQGDDTTDNDGTAPGIFAMRVVKTPVALDQLRISFANFERVAGGDPEDNLAMYNLISSGAVATPTQALGDWRVLLGFGADASNGFRLNPGAELPITVAYISGRDIAAANRNAEWALRMYLNDFQGPSAPEVPAYTLDVYSDMVRIRWAANSETSQDVITQFYDFEGYIVERSTNQIRWETIAAYDILDRLDTLHVPVPGYPDSFTVVVDPERQEFEWQNYNLGMPGDPGRPGSVRWIVYPLSGDSSKEYMLEDRDLIPGHTYYYCVRAFDKGVPGAGILYSGRTGNVQEALMARTAATGAANDLKGVYVYPNPYKGSHPGEEGGQVNPSKGLIEYPRKIYFMGLPPSSSWNECYIRVFSLAGDHLITIDHHNGTEYDQWDLITKNKQEIVSGIYYYTVEYGSKQFIDKFVVIK